MKAVVIINAYRVVGERITFKQQMQALGVCAVEIPVAKKWHGEDSFLFF
jgi:hypothetical protein